MPDEQDPVFHPGPRFGTRIGIDPKIEEIFTDEEKAPGETLVTFTAVFEGPVPKDSYVMITVTPAGVLD